MRPEYRLPRFPKVPEKLPKLPDRIGSSLNFVCDRCVILASLQVLSPRSNLPAHIPVFSQQAGIFCVRYRRFTELAPNAIKRVLV